MLRYPHACNALGILLMRMRLVHGSMYLICLMKCSESANFSLVLLYAPAKHFSKISTDIFSCTYVPFDKLDLAVDPDVFCVVLYRTSIIIHPESYRRMLWIPFHSY